MEMSDRNGGGVRKLAERLGWAILIAFIGASAGMGLLTTPLAIIWTLASIVIFFLFTRM